MMVRMAKLFLLFLLLEFAALIQSGFISIDCGIADNSSYTDGTTGIDYVSDIGYTDTGVSKSISPSYKTNGLEQQLTNVRSFPQGFRNCYTLIPSKLKNRQRYFVRATFMYGNYDNKNQAPTFDIYLGVDYWDTVEFVDQITPVRTEILYNPSSNYTYVCLINTGNGTPFLSVLELRPVNDNIYTTPTVSSLALLGRWDASLYDNLKIVRYGDIFDRVWEPSFFRTRIMELGIMELNTTLSINNDNNFSIPLTVMSNAVTKQNVNKSLGFYWQPADPTTKYFIYFHFADFQSTQKREFNITLNNNYYYGPFRPNYLAVTTVFSSKPLTPATWYNFSFIKTPNSELPPMINALEIYMLKDFSSRQTDQQDVDAMMSIKFMYGVKKNWQGDPCTPENYSWLGLKCFNDDSLDIPRISSLNLSYSGLTGTISSFFVDLNMLQYLDLSNNNLTGEVPNFFSQMQKLSVLNLSGNNFTGSISSELTKRSTDGSLTLSIEGNPYLCSSGSCELSTTSRKKKSMLVPIIAVVAVVIILLIALAIVWVFVIKKKKPQPEQVSIIAKNVSSGTNIGRDGPILTQRRNYTYSEVVKMTRNFEKELGKGGFGSVFHGSIDNTQVAVKMLSPSSAQGYKQFKAEAELLMRVHHRNLTTLVGYCDEGDKLGLIYEFMANGDLETHLSDKNLKCLSWDSRLEIALDAAQGLEYLHHGCKPPIIHRDIKTTNILLNNEMQAKLADFGLSKAFPADGGTHVSTAFAGTPGYFDPEFNMNETSDVYSFGVVLLEILTGKPPIAKVKERTHLSRWVAQSLEANGDVRNVADPRLGNDYDVNSVWTLVDLAMDCVAQTSVQRPSMNQVVIELKRCVGMEKARMKEETQHETNDESTQYSDPYNNLNIESADRNPMAR